MTQQNYHNDNQQQGSYDSNNKHDSLDRKFDATEENRQPEVAKEVDKASYEEDDIILEDARNNGGNAHNKNVSNQDSN